MRRHLIPPTKCLCGKRYIINLDYYFAELWCPDCGFKQRLNEERTIYLKERKERKIKLAQLKLQRMFK